MVLVNRLYPELRIFALNTAFMNGHDIAYPRLHGGTVAG
jgi:hypothetical protein